MYVSHLVSQPDGAIPNISGGCEFRAEHAEGGDGTGAGGKTCSRRGSTLYNGFSDDSDYDDLDYNAGESGIVLMVLIIMNTTFLELL